MQTVLLAVDLEHSENAKRIIAAGKQVTNKDTKFCLLTVAPLATGSMVTSFLPKDYDKQLRKEMLNNLEKFAATQFDTSDNYTVAVRVGSVYEQIVAYADEKDVDVIVLASGKPGRAGLGGNAMRVAQHSKKAIYIIR